MKRMISLIIMTLMVQQAQALTISCLFIEPLKTNTFVVYDTVKQTMLYGVGFPMEYYEYAAVSEDWTESTQYIPRVTLLSARGTPLLKIEQNWNASNVFERETVWPYSAEWIDAFGDVKGRRGVCWSDLFQPRESTNR